MPLLVDFLLPIVTVFVTIRSQVSNWFRFRDQRPVHDLTVGPSIVAFDDLTSEFNKEEVPQHDHYDRRKELNHEEKKYVVDDADAANLHEDKYANDALEVMFSHLAQSGNGLDVLFCKVDEKKDKGSETESSHEQEPSNGEHKVTATEVTVDLMLPREAEARQLYNLYEMPPPAPKNSDQTSFCDSEDSQRIFSWPQWINNLQIKISLFRWKNPFKARSKINKKIPKEVKTAEKTQKIIGKTKPKNTFKFAAKRKKQQMSSDEETKNGNEENTQVPMKPLTTPANLYAQSAATQPKCASGHDDYESMEENTKVSVASRDYQRSRPVKSVQRFQHCPYGTNDPVCTPKKVKKGRRLSWFTSKSKKASLYSQK